MIVSVLIFGAINSFSLLLIAAGLSITLGISGVANFAHGAFYILSAVLCWILLNHFGLPFILAASISVVVVGLLGFFTYWLVILRVRGLILSEAFATIALGVGILEFLRWRGFVTSDLILPFFIEGGIEIAGVFVDYQRLCIVCIGLALLLFLYFFTHNTRIGLSFRGIAQNELTAIALGIEPDWTAALSMVLGSVIAALAAITIIPLGVITINTGYDVLLIAVAVVIIGGVASNLGIFVASLVLGYAQVITAMYIAPQWMMVVYLVAIVLVLAIKPSGLFGKFKELEERV